MIRTGYSFRRAFGHLPDVVSRLKEINWKTAPIADHCSTFGFVPWTKMCREAGLRQVYGVRLNVVPALGEKRPVTDEWCFLAKETLRPLHDLIGVATSNHGREPSLLYVQALAAKGVIKIAGERLLTDHVSPGASDFYVGLSPATPKMLMTTVRARGLPLIAIGDNLYPREIDKELYRVAIGMRSTSQTYPQHILSDSEWRLATSWIASKKIQDEALAARNRALSSCRAEMISAEMMRPKRPLPLRKMCLVGAKEIGIDLTKGSVYAGRLDHELAMIAEKKFEDYFYILAEMIAWAKKRMVVGPARGSSCGSLVCYLLGITSIDPIKYGLMFERFIDVSREELPDVDIDFSDVKRELVFDHLKKTYGIDRVARLGTVGSFQAKSALKQAAASLRIPSWQMEKVSSAIVRRAMGDSRASQTIEDTLTATDVGRNLVREHPEIVVASRLEDHPSNAGQHAAGIVITRRQIADHVAVDKRTGAIMADKAAAESLGLLKIDALGLTQLSIFERTMELIGKKPVSGWLETLPLDDPAAFEVLNAKHFAGIFQFVGSAVRSLSLALLRHDKFRKLDDLVAITALARPGPMGTGGSDEWIRRRTSQKEVTYLHPLFEPYLKPTYGTIVYQEQVMAIGREIGDLSWEDVNQLRRAMSHSYGKEFFDKYGNRWKKGAKTKGIADADLDKIWADLCNFGAMGFNLSHSVAYGMVSYWCCWLKAHHPLEFAAATLDTQKDPADQIASLRELRDEGVDYVSIDPEISSDRWSLSEKDGRKVLVGPLSLIRNIGPVAVTKVLDARASGTELSPALSKRLVRAKTDIDSLFPVTDAVRKIAGGDDLMAINIVTQPTPVSRAFELETNMEAMLIGIIKRIDPTDENSLMRIQKRNGKRMSGPSTSLHMYISDDSGEMFCKIGVRDYEMIGRGIVERGRAGKSIWALKGRIFSNREFTMLWVRQAKYIGDIDMDVDD